MYLVVCCSYLVVFSTSGQHRIIKAFLVLWYESIFMSYRNRLVNQGVSFWIMEECSKLQYCWLSYHSSSSWQNVLSYGHITYHTFCLICASLYMCCIVHTFPFNIVIALQGLNYLESQRSRYIGSCNAADRLLSTENESRFPKAFTLLKRWNSSERLPCNASSLSAVSLTLSRSELSPPNVANWKYNVHNGRLNIVPSVSAARVGALAVFFYRKCVKN